MAKKKKRRENTINPPPGGVTEIFPGEPLTDERPKLPFRKIVFGEHDEKKTKKQRKPST